MRDASTIRAQFHEAQTSGLLDERDTSYLFYDFDVLASKIKAVKEAFGPTFKHTVAVKSNPLREVLAFIRAQGMGLEAASFEEAWLAKKVGAELIAWDSPVKTQQELDALHDQQGLLINANSLDELTWLGSQGLTADLSLRINPQLETGSHHSMTVSGAISKFGEPIAHKQSIIEGIASLGAKVKGLHVHSSSQTTDYSRLIDGVRRVVDLALELRSLGHNHIEWIDVGGGFPASFTEDESFLIEDYATQLKSRCPELFDGTFSGITEFGRYYHANAGWATSRVHEVKRFDNHQVAILHLGADFFLREAYQPGVWRHAFEVIGKDEASSMRSDLAGPLCFGGDYIARGIHLPEMRKDDWIIIRDAGANSIALWSRHCSRAAPKVIGKKGDDLTIIKQRESLDQIEAFWGKA